MTEINDMREMPVNKLMIQMGIPMILSMTLQAVYNRTAGNYCTGTYVDNGLCNEPDFEI